MYVNLQQYAMFVLWYIQKLQPIMYLWLHELENISKQNIKTSMTFFITAKYCNLLHINLVLVKFKKMAFSYKKGTIGDRHRKIFFFWMAAYFRPISGPSPWVKELEQKLKDLDVNFVSDMPIYICPHTLKNFMNYLIDIKFWKWIILFFIYH